MHAENALALRSARTAALRCAAGSELLAPSWSAWTSVGWVRLLSARLARLARPVMASTAATVSGCEFSSTMEAVPMSGHAAMVVDHLDTT